MDHLDSPHLNKAFLNCVPDPAPVGITIILPLLNEQDNILELYERVTHVLISIGQSYELLFVDDGSTDNSFALIEDIGKKDRRVKALKLSRNFGHQTAISAGLEYATGQCVITMDADLQHPPEMIPSLIEKWQEGYDIVYTVREKPEDLSLAKMWTSRLFYSLFNACSSTKIPIDSADFRLIDRKVVNVLNSMNERTRFLRGMISWIGFKQIGIKYTQAIRANGLPKYRLRGMFKFAVSGLTSFTAFPLQVAFYFGLAVAIGSFIYAGYVVYERYYGYVVPGWTTIMVVILFLGGVQLICVGVLGEYISKIFEEVKQRPLFIIENTLNIATRRRALRSYERNSL